MVWGKPDEIPEDKVHFYMAYSKADGKDVETDDYFSVERIVPEFSTIKQVLINNAIPVDLA